MCTGTHAHVDGHGHTPMARSCPHTHLSRSMGAHPHVHEHPPHVHRRGHPPMCRWPWASTHVCMTLGTHSRVDVHGHPPVCPPRHGERGHGGCRGWRRSPRLPLLAPRCWQPLWRKETRLTAPGRSSGTAWSRGPCSPCPRAPAPRGAGRVPSPGGVPPTLLPAALLHPRPSPSSPTRSPRTPSTGPSWHG